MDTSDDVKTAKFGVFELDLESGELHKNGLKVRLQEQPFRLLALLVERQGEVVSREELREKLWPADTYVDFDNSLNTAASKLREALGDSAANPRFIETLPRRGYRFLCPVDVVVNGVNGASKIDGHSAILDPTAPRSDSERVRELTKRIRRERIAFSTVVALLVVSVAFWMLASDSSSDLPLRRFALRISGGSVSPVISPNGKHIAYAADQSLWVQDLDQDVPRKIVDGGVRPRPIGWSPDSRTLAYRSARDLRIVPREGGGGTGFHLVGEWSAWNGVSWTQDGESIIASGWPSPHVAWALFRLPSRGGTPIVIPTNDETTEEVRYDHPHVLPRAAGELVVLATKRYTKSDGTEVVARNLETGQERVLAEGEDPVYSPTGHAVYEALDGSGLWAVPFSIESFGTAGKPFLVRENATDPSISRDGTLVYVDGESAGGFQMAWRDQDGKRLALIGRPQGNFFYPAISPDGSRVIVEGHKAIDMQGEIDRDGEVWIHDVDRPSMERVTYSPENDRGPIWMPSGREILYSGVRAGKVEILRKQIGSHSEPEAVLSSNLNVFASDVSADGKLIVYDQHRTAGQSDIWYLNETSGGTLEPKPFLVTDFEEKAGKISPDGRWLAYVSNETGAYEIYVQRFPEGGAKKRVSDQGGTGPRWSRDGKKLYYVQSDLLIEVDVKFDKQLTLGQPKWLFEVAGLTKGISAHPHYDVSADGERFVVIESVGSTTVRVVQNWFAQFRE